MEKRAVAKTLN